MICVSCNNEHHENFCPNCGEKNGVKKITLYSIAEDTISTITNMDRGFLFNIKTLIVKPQKITANYINGKRKGILNPISFLIISITIYIIIITLYVDVVELFKNSDKVADIDKIPKSPLDTLSYEVGRFVRTNLKFFWVLSIVPLAVSLKLLYKKYNFLEHLAISSFIIGQATLGAVISYIIFKFPLISDPIVYVAILWLIYKIFKENNKIFDAFIISFAALFLFFIQLILILIMIGLFI